MADAFALIASPFIGPLFVPFYIVRLSRSFHYYNTNAYKFLESADNLNINYGKKFEIELKDTETRCILHKISQFGIYASCLINQFVSYKYDSTKINLYVFMSGLFCLVLNKYTHPYMHHHQINDEITTSAKTLLHEHFEETC